MDAEATLANFLPVPCPECGRTRMLASIREVEDGIVAWRIDCGRCRSWWGDDE